MKARLTFFFCIWVVAAQSQHTLTGTVVDSLTKKPISFANVFFANTSVGVVSSEAGEFTLKNFPDGKYDLVVSFVGYKTFKKSITFPGAEPLITIKLKEEAVVLKDVVVTPNYVQKESDLRTFKTLFIGQNRNASACEITNIRELVAYYDDEQAMFHAFARAPLEITNQALGYKLIYELESFEVNLKASTQTYLGYPRFELLTPKKPSQRRKWDTERKRAYEGSFVHLVTLLRKGIVDGPFVLHELYKVPNRKRPSEEWLRERVQLWRNKFLSTRGTVYNNPVLKDSMQYYVKLYNLPVEIDSLGNRITDPQQILDSTNSKIIYKGYLRVVYEGEAEEPEYSKIMNVSHVGEQHSVLLFKAPVSIYDNGYYEKISDVFFDGYMMWSDKISNLLPRDYVPDK